MPDRLTDERNDDQLRLKYLRRSLKTCAGYVNDHDYICKCRPADVREALSLIDALRKEIERLRQLLADSKHTRECQACGFRYGVEHGDQCANCDCDELRKENEKLSKESSVLRQTIKDERKENEK